MSVNIYVGNLPYEVQEGDLSDLFASYGEITSVKVITDRFSGRSKGFGFIEMSDDSAANAAISELDGKEIKGRNLRVSIAKPRNDFRSRD